MNQMIKQMVQNADNKKWEILGIELNPRDKFLAVVLVKNQKGEFVTYIYNSQVDGFNSGNYYTEYENALENFENR